MTLPRLPFEHAIIDPAFRQCLREAVDTPELVENYDRLYKRCLSTRPSVEEMRKFAAFVHDCIYLRLPDDAIESLRAAPLEA